MLEGVTNLIDRMIDRAIAALRALRHGTRSAPIDGLRGGSMPRVPSAYLDAQGQAQRIGQIVKRHCASAAGIVEAHATAAIKLDSAEYTFASMLDELRGVMTKLPSEWAPEYGNVVVPLRSATPAAHARAA